MEALIIELYVYGTVVFGKVLHQEERGSKFEFVDQPKNKVIRYLKSENDPALYSNALYVLGNNRYVDNKGFCYSFKDEKIARQAAKDIRSLVEEYNMRTYSCKIAVPKERIIKVL